MVAKDRKNHKGAKVDFGLMEILCAIIAEQLNNYMHLKEFIDHMLRFCDIY